MFLLGFIVAILLIWFISSKTSGWFNNLIEYVKMKGEKEVGKIGTLEEKFELKKRKILKSIEKIDKRVKPIATQREKLKEKIEILSEDKEKNENLIANLEKSVKMTKKAIDNLAKQKNILENELDKLEEKRQELKIKYDVAQIQKETQELTTKELNNISFSDDLIKEVEREIEEIHHEIDGVDYLKEIEFYEDEE